MKINLITVGKNMPAWVQENVAEYSKRMPADYKLNLIEIPLAKRSKTTNATQIKDKEGEKILAAIPKGSYVITLDEHGKLWNSVELSQKLERWHDTWSEISLLVGGPDGLSKECFARAESSWALSPLTLPHPLVRVIIAEQIYRAWSILAKHPYHRA